MGDDHRSGGEDEEDEVYPRLHAPHKRPGMASSDPLSVRYSSGASREKTLARYSSTLRSMAPMNMGTKAVGSAKVDEAGILSFVTYHWVFEYLWKAFRGRLSKDEDWQCSIYDASDVNMARMQVLWDEERAAARTAKRKPSLMRAVAAFVKTRVYTACAVFLFCLVFGFIGPTCFVRGLVSFAEKPDSLSYAYFLVFGLLFVEVARVLSYGATWAISYRTGIRLRGALLGLVYKHALGVKNLKKTPAEIVNMFANDGQRIFDAITFTPLVLVGPLVLIGGIVYLMVVIGPWALLGILVFFLFDVIQFALGKTMVRCRNEAIKKTEDRMSLMGELIRCIRAIKMNGWERAFLDRVQVLRHSEKVSLRKAGYAQSLAIASGPVVPVVAAILTFLGVVLSGNDLLASDAFSAVTVFFVMLFGIRMIPYGSRYLAEAVVALRRIQEVLESSQWEGAAPTPVDPSVALKMKNATFAWTLEGSEKPSNEETAAADVTDHFHLKELNIVVQKKELIGICGPVGSGKSALLTSIIGHMYPCEGELEVGGAVALVPQVPWIQNATVQENILFGQQMNAKKYYKAIHAAQLTKDLEAMPANELTEIGERGATLSGGQKARVALARALFSNAEILLLDDVLAACDAKVADRIFEEAVLGVLRGKTVLMVTNDVNRLSRCDRVLLLEAGRIVVAGSHADLLVQSPMYSTYCHDASTRYTMEGDEVVVGDSAESEKRRDRVASPADLEFDHLDETNPIVDTEKIELVGLEKAGKALAKNTGKLVEEEEDFGTASVAFGTYMKYVRAAGGVLIWSLLFFAFLFNVVASIFATFWLGQWLKDGHNEHLESVNGSEMLHRSEGSLASSPHTSYYATVYGVSLVLLFVSGLVKAMLFVHVSLNAATRLHNNMLDAIVAGSASFFDQTPSGRLLNRFSKDVDEIDVKMPFTVEVFLQNMLTCIGFLVVITWVVPYFLLLSIPLLGVFVLFVLCFRAGIRMMKRSENISRSPLFAHVTTSLEGIQVIHSHDQSARFLEGMKRRLDSNSASMFVFQSAMRWLAVWLDLLVVGITFIVALLIVLLTGKISPADAGMALAFAIQMSGIFQFAVRTQTEMEAKMTSVERVVYYAEKVPSEGDWDTRAGTQIASDWPQRGQIDFLSVNLRYQPTLPLALSDVSFTVNAGEKVAIIGRTGSGKSSLGNALFRLYPLANGKIAVDGVDIASVGLHRLRRALAVIPQDPVLFAGTIRYNLDPLGQYADHQLWTALEKAHLRGMVSSMSKQLDAEVSAGGENLSVGERQLLCMARALLIKARVVLLDEATASLDAATDRLIWQCISTQFENSTVLVVAHRLNHVHHMNRIIMMDAGKVVEFDEPNVVLNAPATPTGSEVEVEAAIADALLPAVMTTPATTKQEEEDGEETEDSEAELVSEAKISSISDEEEREDPDEK